MNIKKQASAQKNASPIGMYEALALDKSIHDDAGQRAVIGHLQTLFEQLSALKSPKRRSFLQKKTAISYPKSLYIWGNVGRGKSMLMDIFYQTAPVERKRRVHFHAFMQEVHARLHELRQETEREKSSGDPVALLAQQIALETSLLCFDELQATDVADATLLYRLFQSLFAADVLIVSTSNHPPTSLYTGGVQQERFDKFINLLKVRMNVVALSSPDDYRTLQTKSQQRHYVWPLGKDADDFIAQLIAGKTAQEATLEVQGRILHYTQYDAQTGKASFHELCETPLGPADYLALAQQLKTLILTDIPRLAPEKRNEAKRFVTLIDALYEHKVKLFATAAAPPEQIYAHGDGNFEFKRTVSRLMEMQSENYSKMEHD